MSERLIFHDGWFINAAKIYELELGEEAAERQRVTEPAPVKPPENLALFGGDVGKTKAEEDEA